ncbi:MAG TPA: Gfo/Idh/MocA family oxidoreductase [Chitinophagaceae bacterium]
MKNVVLLLVTIFIFSTLQAADKPGKPVRLAVAGIAHGHNGWILNRKKDSLIDLVGIYEPNTKLAMRLAETFKLDKALFYTDLAAMLEKVKPEGVLAFGTTYQHLSVVEACAPRGIPVMVEKPLATSMEHAQKILALSKKYNTLVLTNFETSWYPTTEKTYRLTADTSFMGEIRKVVMHYGHAGPKAIGVMPEFFDWLTDPVQNGGGALTDFGCYGANIMTCLMKGEMPLTVTAVIQHFQPEAYPKVDDEATIILTYPKAQCIIQASWNWPYGRKDMEVYGQNGYAITYDSKKMKAKSKNEPEQVMELTAEETQTYADPFLYFSDVIRKKIEVPKSGLYSLENNLIVTKILDAAKRSAETGKTIIMKNEK